MERRILDGVHVLDLTQIVAGPLCTRMLADLGADVIKVERLPQQGRGPVRSAGSVPANLGKRSIALDLKRPEAAAVAHDLAARADVLVENFAPGVLARLGLGYDQLTGANARLIFASISGFGQSGPQSSRRAYGATAHAEAGLLWVQQQAHDDGELLAPGITVADIVTGMNAFSAVLAALYDREHTGRGQHIDVTLMESQLSMLSAVADAPLNAPGAAWQAFRHPIYRAQDGAITLNDGPAYNWPRIAAGLGHPEVDGAPPEDARELIAQWAAAMTVDEIGRGMQASGAPYGVVRSMPEVVRDPYFRERGTIVDVPDPLDGRVQAVGSPLHFSDAASGPAGPAPLAGEHTAAVLRDDLGYDAARVEALLSSGAAVDQPTHDG